MNVKFALVLCVMATSSMAQAQSVANSFNELRLLVEPGDTVSVISTAGRAVRGTLVDLSPRSLTLSVDDRRSEWREDDVALIPGLDAAAVSMCGAIGTGIGVGLDALITTYKVIYKPRSAATRLEVVPLVDGGRRGALLSIGF